jgi:hypothetical protein
VTVIFVFDVLLFCGRTAAHQTLSHSQQTATTIIFISNPRKLSANMKECAVCREEYDETVIDPGKVRLVESVPQKAVN